MFIIGNNYIPPYTVIPVYNGHWMEHGNMYFLHSFPLYTCTVKPVLRGQLWVKENVTFKTGDFLKEVKFIRNFLWKDK